MKITTENRELVVKIPLKARRFNPYNEIAGEDPDTGEMDNIVGLILKHRDGCHYDECGFAYAIDMNYKGKDDQVGGWAIMFDGSKEEFRKLCQELNLPLWEM